MIASSFNQMLRVDLYKYFFSQRIIHTEQPTCETKWLQQSRSVYSLW